MTIRAISRALAILRSINRHGDMSLSEIAAESDLPHATVSRIVDTLLAEGLIERGTLRKRLRPTAAVLSLSLGYQTHDALATQARPHLEALTKKLGWPVSLVTRVGLTMVVRASTHAQTALTFSIYSPGYTLPILSSAAGKAYLTACPTDERAGILAALKRSGSAEDRARLRPYLSAAFVRRQKALGYATLKHNIHTKDPGKTSSIAVPLHNGGELAGALSLIFFASAMKMSEAEARFAPVLQATAAVIAAAR